MVLSIHSLYSCYSGKLLCFCHLGIICLAEAQCEFPLCLQLEPPTSGHCLVEPEPILKDRYEVIVIGAGIGGLSAASVLAHEGLDVLVLDRANLPGGCCSSFHVGDFTFDAAASILQGFGEFGFHIQRTLFDFLGQQVDLIARDSAYAMYFGDSRIEFHRDRHAFTAELGALFPQQVGSLLSFMRELERIYQAMLDCDGPPRPRSDESSFQRAALYTRHPASVMRLSRYARTSAERVFARYTDDPLAKAFFDADMTFNTGFPLADLSAPHAALAVLDRHIGGTHHAISSAQQIPDRLEKSVVEKRGRVEYRVPVERVLVEDGRAVGVEIAGGKRISADAVVSNTSARDLFANLVLPQYLRPPTLEWLDTLEPAPSVFAIYLGVPEESVPEGFNPNTVVVDDPEREPGGFISVSVPSLFDPYLSPEGYHSMTIYAPTDPATWPFPGDPAYGTEEYEEHKQQEAARVLERLLPILPEIASQPVVWRISSPAMFERFLARERGAIAAARPRGTLVPSGLPGSVTEIRGLFLAGEATFYGRGVAQAAASGVHSATTAMRYLSLRAPRFVRERESYVLETVPVRPQISSQGVVDSISAVMESHRCLRCVDAPCALACPASIDLPNVIRRITSSDMVGAARLVREMNPMGEVCGLVCPAGSLCEATCLRARVDSPVMIAQLEEFVCGVAQGPEGWPEPFRQTRRERVAVIGSGPAGISCAYYLSLLGFNVEVFEQGIEAGGLPAHYMTDSRLNRQVLEREIEGSLMAGVEFRGNTVFGDDINFESLLREGFRAVFLGAGLQGMAIPSIRGDDLPGVIDALSFLGAARRKVKRELTPRVAVVGDSNLAVDTALLALEMGAEAVFLVTTCRPEDAGCVPERLAAAVEGGVRVTWDRKIIEVLGEGRVDGLRTHTNAGAPDESEEGMPSVLPVGTVIMALAREVDPALAGYLAAHLKMSEEGLALVDENMMTSRQGVFAGGDIVSGGRLVVKACAEGRSAALGIARYLDSRAGRDQSGARSSEGAAASGTSGPGFFDKDEAP
jgi:phytoene dehydrogenase-like protein